MAETSTWDTETFVDLTDFHEVNEVLRRGRDFVLSGTKSSSDEFVHGTLVAIDGREHLGRRRALMKMLGPHEPWSAHGTLFEDVFQRSLDRVRSAAPTDADRVRFDLIEFAKGVYWRTTAALVGLDNIDSDDQVARFQQLVGPVLDGLSAEYQPAEQQAKTVVAAREARARIRAEMFQPSYERRLRAIRDGASAADRPPTDLVTALIIAAGDDEPNTDLIFNESVALLAAAVNNPVSQSAFALDDLRGWLARHPEDGERVGEKAFLNAAVRETMRLHRSGRPYLVRIAARDAVLECSGRAIAEGSWVANWLEKANCDPAVFGADAHRYNPHRVPTEAGVQSFGVAFGSGPHVCLGRPLLLWEQGDEQAQGQLTRALRLFMANDARLDPDGEQQLVGSEGTHRFVRYDITVAR